MTTLLNVPGNSAGSMNGDGSRKALLHSVEGSTWQGAVAAYQANNSWPHRTVDGPRRIVVKHLPLDVPARSLRNEAGGVETNREGTILIQYELVGFAATPGLGWSSADWEWFGREVLGPDCRATGVPIRSTVTWVSYPASYGKSAPQRLSAAAWDAYEGICGHQHAPENTHGDPGAVPVALMLASAGSTAPTEEDDMPYSEDQLLALMERAVANQFSRVGSSTRKALDPFIESSVRQVLTENLDDLVKAVNDDWTHRAVTVGSGVRRGIGTAATSQASIDLQDPDSALHKTLVALGVLPAADEPANAEG